MEDSNATSSDANTESNSNDSNHSTASQEQSQPGEQAAASVAQEAMKKFKLKIDGRDEELDESQVVLYAQKGKAADKKFQEAAQMRRQAESFISMLKTDPIKVLSDPSIGVDFRKIAEEYLFNQLQEETLSPEQKKQRDQERKLRDYEEREKQTQQAAEQAKLEELTARYSESYDKGIAVALNSSGIPRTPRTVKRMAELMHKNIQHGFELEPAQLAELVREDYLAEIKELFGAAEGDILLKLVGDDFANKVRKADLARLKQSGISPKKSGTPSVGSSAQGARHLTTEEWKEEIRRRAES